MQRETEDVTTSGPEFPFIQWGNGLTNIVQNVKGKWQGNTAAVGFLFPRTENQEDWDDLDTACNAAGYAPVYIKRSEGASAHWHVDQLRVLALTTKLPKLGSQHADREKLQRKETIQRHGIAFGWRIDRAKSDDGYAVVWDGVLPKVESFIKTLVIVPDLLAQGYDKPLMLTIKSNMTQKMELVLRRHFEIQDLILADAGALAYIESVHAALVESHGVEAPDEWQFPFYGSYLSMGDGGQDTFGKGAKSKDVNIIAIAEPETYDSETLASLCSDANERLVCMQWMPDALRWSLENSMYAIQLTESELDELETMKASRRALNKAAA